ncbi:hypothetical protein MTR67_022508 [Solanum verrucosum]|uniref:Uncharacterized protein n=1 Tax=Solanum verrucosum TaxID=315347 RepID=A0AAF0TXX6_SOLVR|nr:hypothetical protein MTR67_022508 [Solanum verrucosum]
MFLSLTETKWSMPEHTADLLSCWIRRGGSKTQKKWWRIIPHCIWWTIWKERNQRCFEGKQNNIQKIKTNFLGLYYFWCKQVVIGDTEDVFNAIDWL